MILLVRSLLRDQKNPVQTLHFEFFTLADASTARNCIVSEKPGFNIHNMYIILYYCVASYECSAGSAMACVSTKQAPLCRNKDYFTPRKEDAKNGTVVQRYLKQDSGLRQEWCKNKRQRNVKRRE